MKKIFKGILVATFAAISIMSTPVLASDNLEPQPIEIESTEPGRLLKREDVFFDATHQGSSFSDSFTCSPENGETLNIYIDNYSDSPLKFDVYWNGEKYPTKSISANDDLTRSFSQDGGISGKWEVYVHSPDGSDLDIYARARQH